MSLTHSTAQTVSARNNQASPLLRLPGEMLDQIMKYALSIGTIYVDLTPRRGATPRGFQYVDGGTAFPLAQLLGVTRACRALHACYGAWACTRNTFEVYVADIEAFAQRLPAGYAALIGEVRVERGLRWCMEAWDARLAGLAVFGNLRRVRLVVTEGGGLSGGAAGGGPGVEEVHGDAGAV